MKPVSKPLTIALAVSLGLAAGFAVRAWQRPAEKADTPAQSPISSGSSASSKAPAPPPASGSVLVRKTEVDLSFSTGVTRWLVWMTAVEKATLADFPALARMGKNLPGAIRMLAARWFALSPQHLFDSCIAGEKSAGFPTDELASLLFGEWPKNDPAACIAALSKTPGLESQRYNVVNTIMKSDPELGLKTLSAWRIESYGPDMQKVIDWATKDPRHAAEVALENPAGFATELALKAIGEAWGNSDPGAALKYAAGQSGKNGNALANAVMFGWAERDLTAASKWLEAADEPTRNKLMPALMESWGRKNPADAIQWCRENASGSTQKEAIGGLIKGLASKDVDGAASLVSSMEPSPERAQAAGAFAEAIRDEEWFPTSFGIENKPMAPAALTWLNTLDPDSLKSALTMAQFDWANSDPKGFAAFLASPAGLPVAGTFAVQVAQSLCRTNPTEAMAWAGQLPGKEREPAQAATFATWRNAQPDVALQWLANLPANDPQRPLLVRETALNAINWQEARTPPETPQQIADLILRNPPAARSAIQALTLSDQNKQALLKMVK